MVNLQYCDEIKKTSFPHAPPSGIFSLGHPPLDTSDSKLRG